MRNCKKCNVGLEERNTYKSDFTAGRNICKSCRAKRNVEYYATKPEYKERVNARYYANPEKAKIDARKSITKHEDGFNYVYLLKNNYVGVTKNTYQRLSVHKTKGNPYIACILHKTKSRNEALELESLLHDMGYKGKHTNNRYL